MAIKIVQKLSNFKELQHQKALGFTDFEHSWPLEYKIITWNPSSISLNPECENDGH